MLPTLAIAGRPNVGKSTLFNRLVGKSMAIVSNESGVTRDWREETGELFGAKFRLLDTAGLEDRRDKESLKTRVAAQTKQALDQANAILFIVDARAGLTLDDKAVAREIRKLNKPIVFVANKCEGTHLPSGYDEFAALGFGEPLPISASHGEGLGDLYEVLSPYLGDARTSKKDIVADDEEKRLHLAIVGRPNSGKSTLVNQLLGENRMLTGPEPGLTRDAIPIDWNYKKTPIRLVDTAGMRRRSRVSEKLEKLSVDESLRAIRLAHVVVLVIDATVPLEKQDLTIAHHVVEEGRALLIAVNKWDLVKDKSRLLKEIQHKSEASLSQVSGISLVPLSALNGTGLDDLMRSVLKLYETWNIRISTGKLNRWLEKVEALHPPPIVSGRRIKLRYMTQIKSRPPTFSMWVNKPVNLPDSYLRYLANDLRTTFKLQGVPLRWQIKKSDNPYDSKSKGRD